MPIGDKELSGRELSALVAERVMGSVWDETRCRACGWPLAAFDDGGCTIESCSQRPYPARRADEPAQYSSSIEAAMQVVEKMWQMGWQAELVNCYMLNTPIVENVCMWYVRFIDNKNDMNNWSAEANTLPEAICRAALAAIEGKNQNERRNRRRRSA